MVCHCSLRTNESSSPSEKKRTSLSSNKSCTRLCATLPPWPLSHTIALVMVGKGPFLSLKVGCQGTTGWEKDATFPPAWMVDGDSTTGSGIVIPLNDRGGVFDGASPGAFGDGLSRRCFFFARLEELSNCPRVVKTRQKVGSQVRIRWPSFFALSPSRHLGQPRLLLVWLAGPDLLVLRWARAPDGFERHAQQIRP